MSEKLAAALLQLLEFRDGQFRPVIDHKWAKDKTPKEIIAQFECDHFPISVRCGGSNHPTNLRFLTKAEHKAFTHGEQRIFHNKVRKKERKERVVDGTQRWNEEEQCRQEYRAGEGWITLDYDKDAVYNGPLRIKPPARFTTNSPAPKKEELTKAAKEYRKAVYAQRKAKRKAWLKSLGKGGKK